MGYFVEVGLAVAKNSSETMLAIVNIVSAAKS
jgi:hypothetical protein